jgi:hypothetical protein
MTKNHRDSIMNDILTSQILTRLVALALLVIAWPISAGHPDIARQWLDQSHQAAGGAAWDSVRSLRLEYSLKLPGLDGEGVTTVDLVGGRFRDQATLGPYRFANGYDGELAWQQDTSGQVQRQDSQGDREGTVSDSYRRRLAHWYPQRWPAEMADLGETTEGSRRFQRIGIQPEGGRRFVVWIDHESGLIDRFVENEGNRDASNFQLDYAEIEGLQVPQTTRYSTGDPQYDQVSHLLSMGINPTLDEQLFAMPAPPPPDYRFAGNTTETTVPFRLLNNHTYVDITLNGKGPFTMILDTGGVNVITPQVAESLGLDPQGDLEVRGVGEQSQSMSLAQVETVTIGDATVDKQLFIVIDFDQLSQAEGLRIDGLVGYEILKRFATRLDYGRSQLALIHPDHFDYAGGGTPVEFEFDGRTPVISGAIDGIEGKLTFDTGSRNHISLHAPFVEEHGLLQQHPEAVDGINGWGVGGPSRSRVLRGSTLRIGDDILIQRPIMSLSLQEGGAMTDRYQIANLGAGILSRFDLVFDYGSQVVYFERRADSDRQDHYDRAGIWLNDVGEDFEVMGVIEGGPAEQAGLREGDRITRIDGVPSSDLFLPDLRVQWRTQAAGTPVDIAYRRAGEDRRTRLTLRDLIPAGSRLLGGTR